MIKANFLRNVVAIAICLAGTMMFSGCEKDPDDPNNPNPLPTEAVELTSPITQNTTLKDLGLSIDYVYKGTNLLEVKNNAILTIEDSVTIQFTNANGGILITDGATIKALGTADKHIQFVGGATKGSWKGITVETNTANQLKYVDFINGGSEAATGVIYLVTSGARLAIDNCTISGSKGSGVYFANNNDLELTSFKSNKISDCDKTPLRLFGANTLAVIDKTSDLTGNAVNYVEINSSVEVNTKNLTINPTTVPYYFNGHTLVTAEKTLTVNAGTTIYISNDASFNVTGGAHIVVNGGTNAGEKVTFTHLPGSTAYWQGFNFSDSHGNVLKNCLIEYGGNPNNDANIYAYYRSSMSLENVELNNSKKYGFKFNNSTGSDAAQVTAVNVTFSGNGVGNVLLPDETVSTTMP
ncbi:MAG: hypothetical protein LBR51_01050 [Bacteroidales bacterium]|jgi:hypothetical protein|nr:hypothetical protein [Bacteroidales bacterium]